MPKQPKGSATRLVYDPADPVVNWLENLSPSDREKLINGHPGPGGRLGTKDDARTALAYLQDLSAAVKQAASEGKCYVDAMRDIKLPKYEKLGNYANYLPMNIERYCDYYNRGI